jgi:hypothetical protein
VAANAAPDRRSHREQCSILHTTVIAVADVAESLPAKPLNANESVRKERCAWAFFLDLCCRTFWSRKKKEAQEETQRRSERVPKEKKLDAPQLMLAPPRSLSGRLTVARI